MWLNRAWLGALLMLLTLGEPAHAQAAPQPAPPLSSPSTQPTESWSDTVGRLTDALRGTNLGALDRILDSGPIIRAFASDNLLNSDRILGATSGSKLLGMHAYLKVPNSLASDLSDDFKAADVPENLRRDMVLADAASERHHNETAAAWIAQILQPTGGQEIGVIVLWRREKADSFSSNASNRPVFVLVKGELQGDKHVIRQIIFGDPLDKKR
jgi:hypothetical protein